MPYIRTVLSRHKVEVLRDDVGKELKELQGLKGLKTVGERNALEWVYGRLGDILEGRG